MNIVSEGTLNDYRLALLKNRLLLRVLDETSNTNLHEAIILEAGESAALARMTPYPLLLFPCLFEERTGVAMELWGRRVGRPRPEWLSGNSEAISISGAAVVACESREV